MHRFIVGTGRCGSTLLSRMLAENPGTLSLFEFFNGLDGGRRFARESISGAAYADLITGEQPFLTMVYERGYEAPEVLYPFDAPDARYARGDALPWILVATLPALTDRPHELYDEVLAFVRAAPERTPPAHHRALFDWLAARLGREVWVERSGASIDYTAGLDASFEDARFVHIHRAGEEAALSMREHHAFRLAIMLAFQIPAGTGRSPEELRRRVAERMGEGEAGDDAMAELLASRPPAHWFGRWWTDQVLRGFRAFRDLRPEQLHEIRFEDLLREPEVALAEVASFLALPDPRGAWRASAAALVRGMPPARAPELSDDEREALALACRPGMLLLGR